jgi:hypothetical protein
MIVKISQLFCAWLPTDEQRYKRNANHHGR